MPETPAGNDQLTMVALFGHPGHELLIGQILSDASATADRPAAMNSLPAFCRMQVAEQVHSAARSKTGPYMPR